MERHVRVALSSPHRAVEVSSTRRSELVPRERGAGSSSQSGARPVQEDQRVTHSQVVPGGSCASEGGEIPHIEMICPGGRRSETLPPATPSTTSSIRTQTP
jgi:hypothetical protein